MHVRNESMIADQFVTIDWVYDEKRQAEITDSARKFAHYKVAY